MPRGVYPHKRNPATARFWAKVDKNGPVPAYAPHLGSCWLWTSYRTPYGYGSFWDGTRPVQAHRWSYCATYGPIPSPLQCDHLCRVRHCVRPWHIEVVTNRENGLRGEGPVGQHARATHCPQGHPYDEVNTYISPEGWRNCRTCRRTRRELRRRRERGLQELSYSSDGWWDGRGL